MFKEITLEEAKGKILKDYHFLLEDSQAVLIFNDDTFTTLGIDLGYEGGDETLIQTQLKISSWGENQLIKLGIFTRQELDFKRFSEKEAYVLLKRKQEYELYQLLKIKYEGEE